MERLKPDGRDAVQRPDYWRTRLTEIEEAMRQVKAGQARVLGQSAGGRPIYAASYGDREDFGRTANYSSALGARDARHYADKKGKKPVLLIIGGVHGGELEGIAAVLNLVQVMETGADLRGRRQDALRESLSRCRLLLVPCANPDGRAHVPVDTMVGLSFDEFRYYLQGTWKDGTLCGWPACKRVNPIRDQVEHLGGYFNDDGVNLAHDNMFLPMAEETRLLLQLADEEAPDLTVQLHGGDNCINMTLPVAYVPREIRKRQHQFDLALAAACERQGLAYQYFAPDADRDGGGSRSGGAYEAFVMDAAIHHLCGGLCMTYETNMGLNYGDHILTHEQILEHHLILFETMAAFVGADAR